MKKILLILMAVIILGGCQTTPKEGLKSNVVSKTGEIRTKVGEEYIMATDEGLVNITSNEVKLDDYMKKKIKVSGMYSGSTLYVDKIEFQN
jgi:uncharacterized protein YceK